MQVRVYPVAFGRWKGELWDEDEQYCTAIGPRPGCVVRDLLNEYCLKYNEMPITNVVMEIVKWE